MTVMTAPFGEALKLEDERLHALGARSVDYSVMAERLAQLRSRASVVTLTQNKDHQKNDDESYQF